MKCKVESTELSDGAIRNAFNTARKQLPSRGLGLVFLKIPESWLHVPTAGTLLSAVINDFLRGTSRVIAVVVRWEEVYLLARETAAAIISKYRVELGTPPKSFSLEVRALLNRLSNPPTAAWIRFKAIAKEVIERAV
jgi:hypothetical protein